MDGADPVALPRRRSVANLALLACCVVLAGGHDRVRAAEPPRELHGESDAFAGSGVVLAWGILRGASEATTTVVLRVVADPAAYGWIGVVGIDPFSKQEQQLRPVAANPGTLDARAPRARFADFPRTEIRLFGSEAAARGGTPSLVLYYLGLPDTTPEFAAEDKLDAYLADRIARLRGGGGGKKP